MAYKLLIYKKQLIQNYQKFKKQISNNHKGIYRKFWKQAYGDF